MTDHESASEQDGVLNPAVPDPAADGANPAKAEPTAEALAGEIAALKDKLLRSLADMENMRRRTEREIAEARLYGVTSFARDMLTVADNLRRALDSVPAEQRGDGALKAFVEGVELTERDLLVTLERFGVKKVDPLGQRFDPNLHQAMFEIPDESVASGTVVQVVQPGYSIAERVLRPALVGVAKGGPKPAASPAAK